MKKNNFQNKMFFCFLMRVCTLIKSDLQYELFACKLLQRKIIKAKIFLVHPKPWIITHNTLYYNNIPYLLFMVEKIL